MKVEAKHSFFDSKDHKGRKIHEVWDVEEDRAAYLINIGYVKLVEEVAKPDKKKD